MNHSFQQGSNDYLIHIRMTNDLPFKHLLQDDPDTLKSLICSLLHMERDQIVSAEVTNPILTGDVIDDKTVVLDVNVIMNDSTNIDLEMQVINYLDWPERSLIYAGRNLDKLKSGDLYSSVKPSIHIGFLDFQLFEDHPKFYSVNRMMDIDDHHQYTDKLTIGVVDLTNIALATDEDKRYNVDKWAKFFKAKTWEDIDMITAEYPEMTNTAERLWNVTAEEHLRQQCAAREDAIRRENSLKFGLAAAEKENEELKSEIVRLKALLSEYQREDNTSDQ